MLRNGGVYYLSACLLTDRGNNYVNNIQNEKSTINESTDEFAAWESLVESFLKQNVWRRLERIEKRIT